MYIVSKRINNEANNKYFLILDRDASYLKIYEKTSADSLRKNYPIRKDFDSSGYIMYELVKNISCIFGGEGKNQTPAGIFNIEKVSSSEYISKYHSKFDQVKFFGYLVIFEDYFIHSDMYLMDTNIDDFSRKKPISEQDKHTVGCIRVSQDDLYWLINNIDVGTTIEL